MYGPDGMPQKTHGHFQCGVEPSLSQPLGGVVYFYEFAVGNALKSTLGEFNHR
jgi:hypothetical protein